MQGQILRFYFAVRCEAGSAQVLDSRSAQPREERPPREADTGIRPRPVLTQRKLTGAGAVLDVLVELGGGDRLAAARALPEVRVRLALRQQVLRQPGDLHHLNTGWKSVALCVTFLRKSTRLLRIWRCVNGR